eukprot:8331718-Alexandrium_andersonii.AAC.1
MAETQQWLVFVLRMHPRLSGPMPPYSDAKCCLFNLVLNASTDVSFPSHFTALALGAGAMGFTGGS